VQTGRFYKAQRRPLRLSLYSNKTTKPWDHKAGTASLLPIWKSFFQNTERLKFDATARCRCSSPQILIFDMLPYIPPICCWLPCSLRIPIVWFSRGVAWRGVHIFTARARVSNSNAGNSHDDFLPRLNLSSIISYRRSYCSADPTHPACVCVCWLLWLAATAAAPPHVRNFFPDLRYQTAPNSPAFSNSQDRTCALPVATRPADKGGSVVRAWAVTWALSGSVGVSQVGVVAERSG
jgi:hypothetical protein